MVSAITLVKNTGQSAPGSYVLNSGTPRRAQAFTTGSSSDGYVLDSIGIRFETIDSGSDAGDELTVTLQSVDTANNNRPAGELCTLTNPSDLTAAGTHYFAAPTGDSGTCPKLSASTTYAVAVARANNNINTIALAETSSDAEDEGGAAGWTISHNRHRYGGSSWVTQFTTSHVIDVKGHVNTDAMGAPSITGTPKAGQVLTADTSGITDTDGLDDVEYSYQWIRVDGGTDADIPSATNATYTLGPADEGKSVKVKVSFTDDLGFDESLTSAAVDVAQNTAPTGAPAISGTAQVGQTLIALTSGIDDADGLTTAEFEFRWIRTSGGTDTDIAHASSQSYTLGAQDEGSTIKVRVSFADDLSFDESLTSAATAEVSAAAVPGSRRTTDFALSGAGWPTGVWGNAETIWVANNSMHALDKIFAYRRSDGSPDTGKDFDTLNAANNNDPTGLCSDGTTMFVADAGDDKVYAYKMSDRSRDADKDISLHSNNSSPEGLWCDANTVWVSNDAGGTNNKIYAYKRSDGSRDTAKEFDELHQSSGSGSTNNSQPRGLWSNGETMFVVDREDRRVYAYKFSDGSEDTAKNIDLGAANTTARGLWFDGRVLWVSDPDDDKLYAYDLPGARTGRQFWSGTATVTESATYHPTNNPVIGYDADASGFPSSSLDGGDFDYGPTTYTFSRVSVTPLGGGFYQIFAELVPRAVTGVWNKWELVSDASKHVHPIASSPTASTHNPLATDPLDPAHATWPTPAGWSDSESVELSLRAVPAAAKRGPKVGGILQVGQVVTADVSAIADDNGVSADSFGAFQWIHVDDDANETDIEGATDAAYYLTDLDVGKRLKVRVVFNDYAGFEEYPLTSAASAVVAPRRTTAVTTQVRNTGQTSAGTTGLSHSQTHLGQAFTTGSNLHGYALDSVGFHLAFPGVGSRGSAEVKLYEMDGNGRPGDALCTLDDPASFANSGVQTFDAPTGDSPCQTLAANTTYAAAVRLTGSSIPATNVGYTSTGAEDTLDPPTGWTIADSRLSYDLGSDSWSVTDNSAYFIEVDAGAVIGTQVSNTGRNVSGIAETLDTGIAQRAQAFTTGNNDGGYVLSSVGIRFGKIQAGSSPGTELTVTLNEFGAGGNPGGVLCTFTNPSEFGASGVHFFDAPAEIERACPRLPPIGTYFVVVERANATTQDIWLTRSGVSSDDILTPATGWRIANDGLLKSGAGWVSQSNVHMIEVRGTSKERTSIPATGAPAISGTARVGQTLIALASGINDEDGLSGVEYTFRWVRTSEGTDTDIAHASSQSYTLGAQDEGSTIKVRVSFADEAGFSESLTSVATAQVSAAAAPGSQRTSDISVAGHQIVPTGVWGNAETIWVASNVSGSEKIFAYRRRDGGRDTGKDFNTLDAAGNNVPTGLCSDGTTMFVADSGDDKVYGYKMSDRSRDADKDISLHSNNSSPEGLWCDANTVWVSNDAGGTNNKIYAYKRSDGSRDTAKDFDELHQNSGSGSTNNSQPRGLWSNGETMFVVDREDRRVYAYKLSDGSEDTAKNINLRGANAKAHGLWFDGRVLWVADPDDDKLYAYDLPGGRTGRQFWSGTATVTEATNRFGYDTDATDFPSSSLDDDDFDYGPTRYRVKELNLLPIAQDTLTAIVSPLVSDSVATNWELVLDASGSQYVYSLGSGTDSLSQSTTSWTKPSQGARWSDMEAVELSLRAVPSAVTGDPVVSGNVQVTQPVTADVSAISDGNGVSAESFGYFQWIRVDGGNETDIGGANAQVYYPVDDDIGKQLKVRVIFNDHAGFEEYPLTSAVSVEVTPPPESTEVLTQVKNTTVADIGLLAINTGIPRRGQAFTTGPSLHGYVLDSIGFYFSFANLAMAEGVAVRLYEMAEDGNPGTLLCTLDDPAIFTQLSVQRFRPPTSGSLCPTLAPNTTYAAVARVEGSTTTATHVGIVHSTAEDALDPVTGWTVADENIWYSNSWQVTPNQAQVIEVKAAAVIGTLVANTGQTADSSVSNLGTGRPKRAQAFTTGANAGGYELTSVGIRFDEIHASSQPGSELTATLNEFDASGNPGDVLCTLTHPDAFVGSGVQYFDAPTTDDDACPRLLASTSYHFVLERSNGTSQTISLNKTASDSQDTIDPATGFTVAATRRDFVQSSGAWNSESLASMIEVRGTTLVVQPDKAPTGVPTILGTPTVGEILTADTSAIADGDGLDRAEFSYQWVRTSSGSDTDIPMATQQTYTLAPADSGTTIKVKASFDDDEDHSYTLISAATVEVAATAPAVVVSTSALTVGEGSSGTYTVVLAAAPASDVVIEAAKLGGSSDVALSSSPLTLTFTVSNWSAPQIVTVTAAEDDDTADDLAVVTHTVDAANSANEYDEVAVAIVVVTVADNDTIKLVGNTVNSVFGNEGVALTANTTKRGQRFRTGPQESGYRAGSASVWFNGYFGLAQGETPTLAVEVTIFEAVPAQVPQNLFHPGDLLDTYLPSEAVCTLVSPDSYVENGENVFAAPDSCPPLAPDAWYLIVVERLSTSNHSVGLKDYGHDAAPYVDVDSVPGWRTVPECIYFSSQHDAWGECNEFVLLGFEVRGGVGAVPGLDVSMSAMEVTEFGEGSFTAALTTEPAVDVIVDISVMENSDLTVSSPSLTFTPADWNTPQTVTISALNFDLSTATSPTEMVSLAVAEGSSPEYVGIAGKSVEVTVVEGVPGVTVSPTSLLVPEGGSAVYTVVLDARPSASVTVDATVTGGVTVSPSSLTFSASDWFRPQSVMVSAAPDDNLLYELVTVSHAVNHGTASEYSAVTAGDVAVTVIDDEASTLFDNTGLRGASRVFLSREARELNQAFTTGPGSGGFELANVGIVPFTHGAGSAGKIAAVIMAAASPGSHVPGDVVCTLTAPAKYVLGAVNLFTATESCHLAADTTYFFELRRTDDNDETLRVWLTPLVSADDDSAPGWSLPIKVRRRNRSDASLRSFGEFMQLEITGAALPGVFAPSALTVGEGTDGTYTVALATEPTSDVVIELAKLGGSSDVTVLPASLTFSPSTWATPQTVTVTGAEDADTADDLAVVNLTVKVADSAAEYADMAAHAVVVTVAENDTTKLAGNVDAFSGGDVLGLTASFPHRVQEFTTGPQGSGYRVASVSLWFQGYFGLSQGDTSTLAVEVTIAEAVPAQIWGNNDVYYSGHIPGEVVCTLVSPDSYVENGENVFVVPASCPALAPNTRYLVDAELLGESNHAVLMRYAQHDFPPYVDADSADGWRMRRDCTLFEIADDRWEDCDQHEAFGLEIRGGAAAVPGIGVSPMSLEVTEFGVGTLEVELAYEPAGNVTVELSVGDGLTLSSGSLMFTLSDWDIPQPVTVSALNFDLATAVSPTETVSLAVAEGSSPEYVRVADAGVEVTVVEGVAGVTVSKAVLSVPEGGSGAYTVALDARPSASVTVNVSATGDVTVSPSSLTFSATDWQTPKTVMVSAADDDDLLYSLATVSHAVVHGTASEYSAVTAGDVAVTVVDDEASTLLANVGQKPGDFYVFTGVARKTAQSFVTGPSSGGYDLASVGLNLRNYSAGSTGEITAVITTAVPFSNPYIVAGEAVCTLAVPARYVNGAVNLFIATETCHLAPDTTYFLQLQRSDHNYPGAEIWSNGTSDLDDGSAMGWSLPVRLERVTDGDPRSFSSYAQLEIAGAALPGVVAPSALTVGEGTNGTYTVALATEPTADVVIEVAKLGGSSDVTVAPASLTFSSSTWATPQTVTVTAAEDAETADDLAVVNLTVKVADSAAEYADMAAHAVVVTVADNDTTKLVGNVDALSGGEVLGLTANVPHRVQEFTTGPQWSGYRVASVSLWFLGYFGLSQGDTSTLAVEVTIAEAVPAQIWQPGLVEFLRGPIPGEVVCTLVSPDSYVENGENVFVVPASCPALAPNTRYLVDAELLGESNHAVLMRYAQHITSPYVDADSADGWRMRRDCVVFDGVDDRWEHCDQLEAFGLEIRGGAAAVPGIGVSPMSLEVTEFGVGTLEVELAHEPAGNVTVELSVGGGLTLSSGSLMFTLSDWDIPQPVTVSALNFDLATASSPTETVSVSVADGSSPEYLRGAGASVEVTVVEGVPGVTVSEALLSVPEGGSGTYTVALNARPSASVTVNVSVTGDVTVSPSSLTFSATDWQTPKTVMVSAADDDDLRHSLATVSHAVVHGTASEYSAVTAADVAVIVVDDEASTLAANTGQDRDELLNFRSAFRKAAQAFATGSNSGGYELASVGVVPRSYTDAPSGEITAVINSAVSDATLGYVSGEAVCTLSAPAHYVPGAVNLFVATASCNLAADTSYFFELQRSANSDPAIEIWGTAASGLDDGSAMGWSLPHSEQITVGTTTASTVPTRYMQLEIAGAALPAVVVSETSLTVDEGDTGTYTVALGLAPTSDVVIDVGFGDGSDSDVTVLPASLTFTPQNWAAAQDVTVSAGQDVDSTDDTATVTHAVNAANSADEYDSVSVDSVSVTVTDDETGSDAVTVSVSELALNEAGTGTYTVVLGAEPTSDVVIDVAFGDGSDSDVEVSTDGVNFGSTATLTFTSSTWSAEQTVTVSAAADDDSVNDTATVTHTVNDDDSADEYDGVSIASVTVEVTDDDPVGLTLSTTSLDFHTEGQTNGLTYSVKLDSEPSGEVTVDITLVDLESYETVTVSTDGTFGTTASLTFDSSNWSTPQVVTVLSPVDDNGADVAAKIRHTVAAGSAAEYVGVTADLPVTVPDFTFLFVTTKFDGGAAVLEGGSEDFEVVLTVLPTANVTVDIAASGALTVSTDGNFASSVSLLFTPSNWETAQIVTVSAAQDDGNQVHETESLTTTVAAGSAAEYVAKFSSFTRSVVVADDDTGAGVTVSPVSLEVEEGDSVGSTYTVVLDALPSTPVAVSVVAEDGSDVTVDLERLVFETGNWNTPQTVTVTAAGDADMVADSVAISHAVEARYFSLFDLYSALEYVALASVDGVDVTVVDDDGPSVSVSELAVGEGGTGTYTVVLNVAPTSDVVIDVAFGDGSDGDVSVSTDGVNFGSTATLTFTSSTWSTVQTVTVSAAADDDSVDDTATVTHTVDDAQSDNNYDGVPIPSVAVTVADDDSKVIVSVSELAVVEAGTGSYTVVLGLAPGSDVVVDVAFGDGSDSDVSVSTDAVNFAATATLTFTSSNWATVQTVTVKAAGDDDSVDDTAMVTHTVDDASSDDAFDGLSIASVDVTVDDDDPVGLTLSKTSLAFTHEGQNGVSYSVELDSEPSGEVTVDITLVDLESHETVTVSTDGTFGTTASLTFDSSNWSTPQVVTVKSPVDDNGADVAAKIRHTVAAGSAAEYVGVTADLPVTVLDFTILFVTTIFDGGNTVLEGGSKDFEVALSAVPTANVTVDIAASGALTVSTDGNFASSVSLLFTPSNWETDQIVTVSAAQDDGNQVHETESLRTTVAAGSAAEYVAKFTAQTRSVVVADDDTGAGVTVSPATLEVAEGSTGSNDIAGSTYMVVLDALPSTPVAVSVVAEDGSDVTVDLDELVFDTGNWNTPQTVTVTAAGDADMVADSVAISHAVAAVFSAGSKYSALEYVALASVDGVDVTVVDDDGPTVSVSELAVGEGGTGTYTVVLNVAPTSDVVIDVAFGDGSDSDVQVSTDGVNFGSTATLTFTSSDWATVQTVTVSAAADDDSVDDTATVTHAVNDASSDNAYDGVPIASVDVTVDDSSSVGLTLSTSSSDFAAEGQTGVSYTVALDSQPTADVTVDITVQDLASYETVTVSTDGTFGTTASLTFDASNWSTPQVVTVLSPADDNGADVAAKIRHAVAAGSAAEYVGVTADLPVTVPDITIVFVTANFDGGAAVLEGGTKDFKVAMSAAPTANVTVNVNASGALTVSTDGNFASSVSLLFTPSNWETPQIVTVAAAQDVNQVHETESLVLTVAAGSAAEYVAEVSSLTRSVVVADDDTSAGVTVSPATLEMAEGSTGSNDIADSTYTVVLDALPSTPVAVSVTAEDDSGVTVSPEQLVFYTSNWSTPQTVTVTAAADDADVVADSAAISHAVEAEFSHGSNNSALEYVALASVDGVAVTVVDDDGPTVSVSELAVGEGGTGTYTVVLNVAPASDVVIDVAVTGDSDVQVSTDGVNFGSTASLTFTSSDWNMAQTVTVSAAADDDKADDTATVTHTVDDSQSDDDYDGVPIDSVAVSVDDDDVGVSVSPTELGVDEGSSAGYDVVLEVAPGSDVVIDVAVTGDGDVTVSPSTLTFTALNWSTVQTVTVSAAADADKVDDTATVTHTVDDSQSDDDYDGLSIDSVAVSVDDDDVGVSVSPTELGVDEGSSAGYDVVLEVAPGSDVVIDVAVTGDGDVSVSPATLTFTALNWSTVQTVTVSAAADADRVDDAATVTHTVDDSQSDDDYDGLSIDSVAVSVDDDDVGVSVSPTELGVDEGSSAGYDVVLEVAPGSDVVIDVAVSGDGDVSVSPSTLTFTALNWSTAQTVTVSAAADADRVDDAATVTHTVDDSQSDDDYDGLSIDSVAVSVDDDDVGVSVSPTELGVGEGSSAGYDVVLEVAPGSDVVIDVAVTGDGDVSVSPATLTFTALNWSTAQTVTVSAAADADKVDDTATVTHTVDDSQSDDDYDGLSIDSVAVSVDDDDVGVSVSPTELGVGEGSSAGYDVVLEVAPGSDVVIDVAVSGDGDVSVSPSTLTFTALNWSTAQTVTVSAAADADKVDDTATVTHTVDDSQSDDDYDGLSIDSVAVSVDDDDVGVSVSPTELGVGEGSSAGYDVVLEVAPGSDVVIDVAVTGDGDVSVSPATLTFTALNWSTAQTVTVSAAADADKVDDTATVTHTVDDSQSDDDYDGLSIDSVAVSVDDDDVGVSVSPTELGVGEGSSAGYDVVLEVAPGSDVVIDVAVTGDGDVSVSPATLTFTALNWSTAQTVTVSAAADADKVDDTATVTHTVDDSQSDDDYDGLSIDSVAVSVDDDDVGVSVSPTELGVDEGSSAGYDVVLEVAPGSDVVIDVAVSGDGDVSVSPSTLTFTALNWSTAQTVTVSAAADADKADDTATVTHTVDDAQSDDDYDGLSIDSVAVSVDDTTNSSAMGAPTISGTAQVDETVTASVSGITDADGLSGVQFNYQWIRTSSGTDTDIPNATNQTYQLAPADEGATIKVRVSFTDQAGHSESLISVPTVVVLAAAVVNSSAMGAPTISGTAQVDETVTASVSGITDADGLSGVQFNYQWIRTSSGTDTDIPNATNQSYQLAPADEGATIKVRVSFTDQAGHSESLISVPTVAVRTADDPGLAVTNVEVTKGGGPTATTVVTETNGYVQARVRLAWDAPVAQVDEVVGYRVERRTHYCYADPAGVDRLTFWSKVNEWDFEQATARHAGDEFSVDPSQLSFVDLGHSRTYVGDDGTEYTTQPSGVSLSSAESGNGAFVTIRREYRIVTIRDDAEPVYSSSLLVGYDHTASGNNRITVTPQPTELSEPNCAGTAPAITLGDIAVTAIGTTTATVTVPIDNADNTWVYFGYATNTIGWQYRYVRVSSSTATVTLTGLEPGTRYYVQASLDQGFDFGRNRVTNFDTLPGN